MVAKKAPQHADIEIGQRVRHRRTALGLSQEKLADEIGLTFQQVQKYEKGMNRIGGSRMVQIAKALNCPVSFFFGGDGSVSGNTLDDMVKLTQDSHSIRLMEAFDRVDSSGARAAIVHLVEAWPQAKSPKK